MLAKFEISHESNRDLSNPLLICSPLIVSLFLFKSNWCKFKLTKYERRSKHFVLITGLTRLPIHFFQNQKKIFLIVFFLLFLFILPNEEICKKMIKKWSDKSGRLQCIHNPYHITFLRSDSLHPSVSRRLLKKTRNFTRSQL